MIVRKIKRADLAQVHQMIKALSAHHGDEAQITFDQLERDTMGAHPWVRVLVAEVEGALIGYAGMIPQSKLHYGLRAMDVHHLFVREAWRSKGAGQALLKACEAEAAALGCANLTIGTAPDNVKAQEVYKAYGFEEMQPGGPQFKLLFAEAQ